MWAPLCNKKKRKRYTFQTDVDFTYWLTLCVLCSIIMWNWKYTDLTSLLSDLDSNVVHCSLGPTRLGPSSIMLLWRRRKRAQTGRCCWVYCGERQTIGPSSLGVLCRVSTASDTGKTWLDTWRFSALFRGLLLLFPKTQRCSRQLPLARVCNGETVSRNSLTGSPLSWSW